MNNGFQWWLVILGIGLGAGLLWLVLGRLPRQDDDVGPREREAESIWISQTIEAGGGIAPTALVEEILELHASYLEGPALLVEPAGAGDAPEAEPAAGPADADEGPGAGSRSEGPLPSTTSILEPVRRPRPGSVGHGPAVQRHDARRESPEADVRQPG